MSPSHVSRPIGERFPALPSTQTGESSRAGKGKARRRSTAELAAEIEALPAKKTRGGKSFSATINTSDPNGDRSKLRGTTIPKTCITSAKDLALWTGLGTSAAVKAWLTSKGFTKPYNQLYDTVILPRDLAGGGQGPSLQSVQSTILAGEDNGEMKYSADEDELDKENWNDLDWYAYTLLKIRKNSTHGKGQPFRGKSMGDEEVDVRCWHAIQRETRLRHVARMKQLDIEKKTRELRPSVQVFADEPVREQTKTQRETLRQNLQPPRPVNMQKVEPSKKRRRQSRSRSRSGSPGTPRRERRARLNRSRTPGASKKPSSERTTSPGGTMYETMTSPSGRVYQVPYVEESDDEDVAERNQGAPFNPNNILEDTTDEEESVYVPDDNALEEEDEALEGEINIRGDVDDMCSIGIYDRLLATKNQENPWDINTPYGIYATIHAILANYDDKVALERLKQGPISNADADAEIMNEERRIWEAEIEAIVKKKKTLEIKPTTDEEQKKLFEAEKLRDNPAYQPMDYLPRCKQFGMDPKRPQFPSMHLMKVFRSWQVTGMGRVLDMYENKTSRAGILADLTGLGKTITMLGVLTYLEMKRERQIKKFNRDYTAYIANLDAQIDWHEQNGEDAEYPHEKLSCPEAVPPAKPILLIVLSTLINQWVKEIKAFSDMFTPVIYHGDEKTIAYKGYDRITETLTKDHEIFNGREENSRKIIITSLATFNERHGPGAVKAFRTAHMSGEYNEEKAEEYKLVFEPKFTFNLDGCFHHIVLDEAHVVKNDVTAGHTLVKWMRAGFIWMLTATVCPNRIEDFQGYIPFIELAEDMWTPANLTRWRVNFQTNPFELEDDHPAACLRYTTYAVKKWITSPDKNTLKKASSDVRGMWMAKVWERCLVRRTYASKDPANPNKLVGDDICKFNTRRIISKFTPAESEKYESLSFEAEKNLIMYREDKVLWNRKWSRKLQLNSSWLGFHYIADKIHANTVPHWKKKPELILWYWTKLLREEMKKAGETKIPDLPDKNDVFGLLSIFCRGSPKLRATLRIIADLVVLQGRKLLIWCSVPATQLLLEGVLAILGIKGVSYTSDMNQQERVKAVKAFTEDNKCKIFIGSWFVGSFGLNLQDQCNHSLEFDHPWSMGVLNQGRGRLRRIGQLFNVENFELYCLNSFQSRIIANAIGKNVPNTLAEMCIKLKQDDRMFDPDADDRELEIASEKWYLAGDELVQAPDPRIGEQHLIPLSAEALSLALMDQARGAKVYADDENDWEEESLDLLPGVDVPSRQFDIGI